MVRTGRPRPSPHGRKITAPATTVAIDVATNANAISYSASARSLRASRFFYHDAPILRR